MKGNTKIISDPARGSQVLPVIEFPMQVTSQDKISTVSIKGQEKELLPAPTPVLMSASPSIWPGSHNLNIQPSMGSSKAMSQQIASKV